MVTFKNSVDLLADIRKKNLTVVAIQREDGFSIFWITNSFGDMWFVQINSN